MPIDLAIFGRLRPYLYHLTDERNLARIRRTRVLESAGSLASRAGLTEILDRRRREHRPILIDDEIVILRDQAPLHEGNMRLDEGWDFPRLVRHINDRVFFWPGGADGPISYGLRHFGRYESESPAIIRVRFDSFLDVNSGQQLRFSKCNSGSPRWSRGIPGSRGANTFVPPEEASFRPAHVVEVTVCGEVVLPDDTEIGARPGGPWSPFLQ